MPPGLRLGPRQEREEFRRALVLLGRPAAHHPQRRAADDRVLRRAFNVGPVRLHAVADIELGVGEDRGARRRRADEDAAFAGIELRLGLVGPPAIIEQLGLLPRRERRNLPLDQRIVDLELGV